MRVPLKMKRCFSLRSENSACLRAKSQDIKTEVFWGFCPSINAALAEDCCRWGVVSVQCSFKIRSWFDCIFSFSFSFLDMRIASLDIRIISVVPREQNSPNRSRWARHNYSDSQGGANDADCKRCIFLNSFCTEIRLTVSPSWLKWGVIIF